VHPGPQNSKREDFIKKIIFLEQLRKAKNEVGTIMLP
jgi:hypothetical protein